MGQLSCLELRVRVRPPANRPVAETVYASLCFHLAVLLPILAVMRALRPEPLALARPVVLPAAAEQVLLAPLQRQAVVVVPVPRQRRWPVGSLPASRPSVAEGLVVPEAIP